MTNEDDSIAKPVTNLWEAVGKCVSLKLRSRATRLQGHLWTVDPETQQVILFLLPSDDKVDAKVFHQDDVIDCHLVNGDNWDPVFKVTDRNHVTTDETEKELKYVTEKLDEFRIPFTIDGSSRVISVLHGSAKILPPYRSSNVQSGNEIVLSKLMEAIWQSPRNASATSQETEDPLNTNRKLTSVNLGTYSSFGPKVKGLRNRSLGNPPAGVNRKYWHQRHRLFSRFDEGIQLDPELWYSVTPEAIAEHIAERCRCEVVVDAFAGGGGNTIQFAFTCERVLAIDIDQHKLSCVQHNAMVYGVEDRVELVQSDVMSVLEQFARTTRGHLNYPDIVFLSPPWGGPNYQEASALKLEDIELACPTSGRRANGLELLRAALKVTPHVVYFLPRNIDLDSCWAAGAVEIEKHVVKSKVKTICAYFGDEFWCEAENVKPEQELQTKVCSN